jgi:hypothetical protein
LTLGLAVSAAALPTFAAGGAHGIAGKITNVSSTSLQVQTASGAVTEQLTSSTRIMKEAKGSLGDLTPGAYARVTLAAGTATVTAVHLESKVGTAGQPRTGTRPRNGSNGSTTTKPKTGLHHGGQIVSAANGQLTLRNRQGQTTTYKLGASVSVTKTVSGQLSDLSVGEAVRVVARPGSTTAIAVIIESA